MGFLQRLGNAWTALRANASSQSIANMTPEQLLSFLRQGSETAAGEYVTGDSAMRVATAWRCVTLISGAIAGLPRDVIRRTETTRNPATGHPLRRVLTVKPNGWQTPTEFVRLMTAHVALRGNAYARKVVLGADVVALLPLHPDRMVVEQQPSLELVYTYHDKHGRRFVWGQSEILHLRGLTFDGVTGLSAIAHAREALGTSLAAERAASRVLKNGVLGGNALTTEKTLTAPAIERIKESLEAKYQGADNAGKTLILEEGLEPTKLGFSAQDSQFLEQREFTRADIAMFFGCPPHLLGITEKTTSWGAGIEAQNTGFVTYTLSDYIAIWQDAVKRDCMTPREADTLDFRIYTSGLLRGDSKARWEAHVKALQWGVYSPDEVRRFEDENPRPDGKGGIYYEPPNTAGGANGTKGNQDDAAQAS